MSAASAPSYLAIDLGASSGRAVIGTLERGRMSMREVRRFRTPLIDEPPHLFWDIDALWAEICAALDAALRIAPALRSVSVDSWGVDYVPLDRAGNPVRRPYAYRDPRTHGRLRTAIAAIDGGADALYARTGTQFLDINTLPQIVTDLAGEPDCVARTTTRLLIADFFLYKLSGVAVAERSLASTTQMLDATAGGWAADVIDAIGDDPARWPRIVQAGTVLGPLQPWVAAEAVGAGDTPAVIASCSHDTAAAVAAVPAAVPEPWAYISSGTWSLVGVERDKPLLTGAAHEAGFTNEVGLDGTIRLLKNRTGMWVLEECMREWDERGMRASYATLVTEAASASPIGGTLDLDAPDFGERGDMLAKVSTACRQRGLRQPESRGGVARLLFESLADCYRRTLDELETLTGQRASVVHVVGGGARSTLLNQLTADACERPVIAGPDEATTLGNLLVQARALGDLHGRSSVRDVARVSTELVEFQCRQQHSHRS